MRFFQFSIFDFDRGDPLGVHWAASHRRLSTGVELSILNLKQFANRVTVWCGKNIGIWKISKRDRGEANRLAQAAGHKGRLPRVSRLPNKSGGSASARWG
jgi:hypothetical protein